MKKKLWIFVLVLIFIAPATLSAQETIYLNDTSIFMLVPNMPILGKNKEDLQLFIQRTSKIPTSLKKTDTSRNVFVQVIVDTTGKAVLDRVFRSPATELTTEAKAVIEKMPMWTPGTLENGKKVKVYFSIPFWFE